MQSQTIKLESGLNVHYLEAGAGAPVVFLHGWPTHAQLWRHALPAVAPHRRAIAIDLPGFGQSDKPVDVSYSFRFFDEVMTQFLTALDIDRVGLVVHDLGGPIGLHWAAKNPERVTELGILNTLAFPELSLSVKAFVVAARLPGLSHLLRTQWAVRKTMRFGVCDKSKITDEIADMYAAPFATAGARRALIKAAYGLHPRGFETIAAALPELNVPTRLLYGEADKILVDVAKTMARLKAVMPHAELTSIPECGHFLQEDRPTEVAQALAVFFGR